MDKSYAERGYSAKPIGFGEKPGIVVVDYQIAFTDPSYPTGGAPLVRRGLENTARLLKVARQAGVPVAACYICYHDQRDTPYWKVESIPKLVEGHPGTRLDPLIHDPTYDYVVRKTAPSIFFNTPVVAYFAKARVDTMIVTGCITSGCVRASVVDSFSLGFRTIVPEDCVGDHEDEPHRSNLRDIERRYCDVSTADEVIAQIERWRQRNQRD
jgi:maleamate amidohydrolase